MLDIPGGILNYSRQVLGPNRISQSKLVTGTQDTKVNPCQLTTQLPQLQDEGFSFSSFLEPGLVLHLCRTDFVGKALLTCTTRIMPGSLST
jgi:hypothetical protein